MFINVAIAILVHENRFLLVRRKKGNFPNLWGLIGGKVEEEEHIDEAIIRELKEETEIVVEFKELLGVATEMVTDKKGTSSTVLYCCLVNISDSTNDQDFLKKKYWVSKNEKMELQWFTKEELCANGDIVGSDLDFIKHFYFLKDNNYLKVDCKCDESGKYTWRMV